MPRSACAAGVPRLRIGAVAAAPSGVRHSPTWRRGLGTPGPGSCALLWQATWSRSQGPREDSASVRRSSPTPGSAAAIGDRGRRRHVSPSVHPRRADLAEASGRPTSSRCRSVVGASGDEPEGPGRAGQRSHADGPSRPPPDEITLVVPRGDASTRPVRVRPCPIGHDGDSLWVPGLRGTTIEPTLMWLFGEGP